MLSITIQSFSCSLDVEVFDGTNEEMMSVSWPGRKWGRWWMDDEECSMSTNWSNSISLRKKQMSWWRCSSGDRKFADVYCSSVWRHTWNYIDAVHKSNW